MGWSPHEFWEIDILQSCFMATFYAKQDIFWLISVGAGSWLTNPTLLNSFTVFYTRIHEWMNVLVICVGKRHK